MLDQERNPPPPEDEPGANGASGAGAGAAAPPRRDPSRPTLQAWTDHVAGSVTASTHEVLKRFAAELHDVLATMRDRLDEASARLGGELEVYRDVPGQIAEALETLGQALAEVAGAQAAVDQRLEVLADGWTEQIASATATAAERHERLSSSMEGLRASLAEVAAAQARLGHDASALRSAVSGDVVEEISDAVTVPLEGLREEVEQLRAHLETGGKSRPAARLAADLSAVESRLEQVETAVGHDLVEAVFDRMEQAFDRRFDALVQVIDARLRERPPAPEEPARRGLLRRA